GGAWRSAVLSLPPLAGEAARRADGGRFVSPPPAFGTSPRCAGGGMAWLPPAGEGCDGGVDCDFAGSSGFAAAPPSSASIVAITLPSEISSPTLTFISLTVPANGAGTSMVALADSSVTRPWSFS